MLHRKSSGQALIEFIFVLLFAIFFTTRTVSFVGDFMRDSFGNMAHVLSINLAVGVCPQDCFFSGYSNGFNNQ